MMADIRGGEI